MTTRRVLAGSLVLLAIAFWVSTRLLAPVSAGRAVALTDVLAAADRHAISSATLYDVDDRVRVRLRDGSEVTASYPHSSAATAQLVAALARSGAVRVDPQTAKATLLFARDYLLPVLVLAALFGLVLTAGRADGGADGYARFSRVRRGDRVATGGPKNVTFADVAGAQYAVTELAEIVDYLREPARFAALGALPPKGVLLVGPPGTGKTLLARAVAGEADVPFFALSGAEFVESLVGVGAARVRDLFAQVRAKAPAILFIDELDAAGRKRGAGVGGGNDEREQTLNQLLVEMDGFAPASGVVVIAATNRPDILDPALLRPGRFDRMVTVDKPDLAGRREILGLHGAGRPVADDLDLDLLARRTAGLTGADLANVWREAALLAVRDRAARIDHGHLDEAVVRVLVGPSRPGDSLSADERRIVAVHESGHAVVAAALGLASALDRVSIARRGAGLGHTTLLADDRALVRRSDLLDRMAAALGGRAAEEVVLGESTTGAEGDIERATEIAAEMAGRYGMSEGIGPVRIHVKDSEVFLGRDLAELQQVSQETLSRLDVEVRTLVEASVERARAIVSSNLATVQSLADALVARDTVSGAALAELLRDVETSDASVYPQSSRQPRRTRARRDPA